MSVVSKIYPLADALQMHLSLNKANNQITGESSRTIPLLDGLSITTRGTIISSYVGSNEDVGVLIHVAGSLYVLCSSISPIGTIVLRVIDGGAVLEDTKKSTLIAIVDTKTSRGAAENVIKAGIVKSYMRKANKWMEIDNGRKAGSSNRSKVVSS